MINAVEKKYSLCRPWMFSSFPVKLLLCVAFLRAKILALLSSLDVLSVGDGVHFQRFSYIETSTEPLPLAPVLM